jgi:hypothetical protein
VHDGLVKIMLTEGINSVVHMNRRIFVKNKQNFIIYANVFVDLNIHFNSEIPYIFFLKPVNTKSGYLIANDLLMVESFSTAVLEMLELGFIKQLPYEL